VRALLMLTRVVTKISKFRMSEPRLLRAIWIGRCSSETSLAPAIVLLGEKSSFAVLPSLRIV